MREASTASLCPRSLLGSDAHDMIVTLGGLALLNPSFHFAKEMALTIEDIQPAAQAIQSHIRDVSIGYLVGGTASGY